MTKGNISEEGGNCPVENCGGRLVYKISSECYCHINPPCHFCVDNELTCENCD